MNRYCVLLICIVIGIWLIAETNSSTVPPSSERNGESKNECPPGSIDSIASARQYRGCTHITGSLWIQIRSRGYNILKELENSLADIEVIEGALKVFRSSPIVSFSFFKKLRVIKGLHLEMDDYGLVVFDNQNLQSLFPHNVTIDRGKLYFHMNPKLCPTVIEALKEHVIELRGVVNFNSLDVSRDSNGDKIACNITELKTRVVKTLNTVVLIELTPLVYEDDRSLLGYTLYYMETPYTNVSMFDGRDACGDRSWEVEEIVNVPKNTSTISLLVTHLKPSTQYAYYIETHTIASELMGGRASIQYFRTQPDESEPVQTVIEK